MTSRGLSGVLLVDKPEGPTSFGAVAAVRRMSRARRCGHTGTLDPFASGLLVVCMGPATRLARFVGSGSKRYRAAVRFGWATDTYDLTGRPVGEKKDVTVGREAIEPLLAGFLGKRLQVPPPFSAKKVGGERLYRLAREGHPVRAEPAEVFFESIVLESAERNQAVFTLSVGSGTYVRSFAHDLGAQLGVGAHLEGLRRTRVGPFFIEEARTLEALEDLAKEGRVKDAILAPADALPDFPLLTLSREDAVRVRHGQRVGSSGLSPGVHCRLVDALGELVAVGLATANDVRPVVVLA